MNHFNYKRRATNDVQIGNVTLGSGYPIVVQTMTNTDTLDTEASVEQCERIIKEGGQLIRLTAQGVKHAENLKNIHQALRDKGYNVPLSADIHFNPRAAITAAKYVEKVRINPGNFVDRTKSFATVEYTDEEYAKELEKIEAKFIPFLDICKEHNTAVRIGVNHGSLSDRIMSRYGDTPEGMVESCLEYLRIAVAHSFLNIVISMKSSNTLLMTKSVRLLIERMDAENMHFPLHLGVTEAGGGEDGRIKSAVGIGALLSDGIGDTIRVSLSEDPECELPVAQKLVNYISLRKNHAPIKAKTSEKFCPISIDKRTTHKVRNIGGDNLPIVITDRSKKNDYAINLHFIPDYVYVGNQVPTKIPKGMKLILDYQFWTDLTDQYPLFTSDELALLDSCNSKLKFLRLNYSDLAKGNLIDKLVILNNTVVILETNHVNGVGEQRAFIHSLLENNCSIPVVLHRSYNENEAEDLQIKAGVDLGTLLLDGFGNGIMLSNKGAIAATDIDAYMFGILQAARVRTSKTEFISCPGCGRTLFNLQDTVEKIKESFSHLKTLKIGVMGCIVNGPGEMADADYGYVGAEPGKISLYKKKERIEKNIPEEEAVERLIALIKEHGDWVDP
ncbi:MAG: 4-hydroxy-3-methylbut-2-en-1-yl diphosphate synthase [Dysgonamonadaceae bacterium]|nr:4-hydroxy-3-methylbut-2-en-1-yl diphosphate synthase [Dysgonamonadaceae bacterium]MDD4728020.1 4-hydroxy-3-methylbut-2-en-1-yl diphosphate synthase [Dysgonamonadaceae bacterium]